MPNKCNCNNPYPLFNFGTSGSGTGGLDVIVDSGGVPITVTENITTTRKKYTVGYDPYYPLESTFSLSSLITNPSGSAYLNGNNPLKGATVTDVDLSWTFSKNGSPVDVSQTINGEAIIPNSIKTKSYTELSMVYDDPLVDRQFILIGDDGTGNDGSTTIKTITINFADKVFYVEATYPTDESTIIAALQAGNFLIQTNKNLSLFPQSLESNKRLYIAIPYALGATEFRDLSSPLEVNPMTLLIENLVMTNGLLSNISHRLYVSLQGALLGSNIVTI